MTDGSSRPTGTQVLLLVLKVEVLSPEDVPSILANIREREFQHLRSKGPQRIGALRPDRSTDHLWLAG